MKVQTSDTNAVRVVCFSPEKRVNLQQCQTKQTAVSITEVRRNEKRLCSFDEYTMFKKSKVTATDVDFDFNVDVSNRLRTVTQVLAADLYETVDINVKVMIKEEERQTIIHGSQTKYKVDAVVADETDCIKLALWENTIDKVKAGKSYKIENCKVRIFNDSKFLNTNEFTKITEIDNIVNINLSTPELESHLVIGQCVGVEIKRSTCCISCNTVLKSAEIGNNTTVKCPKCQVTMLVSSLKTKLVCQLLMDIEGKFSSYTAFNDAIDSFCRIVNYEKTAAEVDEEQLTLKLLSAGPQKLLVDKCAKKICQFLALE